MAKKDLKQELQKKPETTAPKSLKQFIAKMKPQIAAALPAVITPERFTRIAMTAIAVNPKLAACTQDSFIAALMSAAQLGLEPNTPLGQAYLIPYNDYKKGTMQVQFQLGYRGLIDLCYRSGEFTSIDAHIVYENDDFEYEYGIETKLRHVPSLGDRGKPIRAYALFKLKNGGFLFKVMGYDEAIQHGKDTSKTFNNGPWKTFPKEMVKKTVLKALLKYAPIKVEFMREVMTDNSVKTEIVENMTDVVSDDIYVVVEEEKENPPVEKKADVEQEAQEVFPEVK